VIGVRGGGPSVREWQLFAVGTALVWVHVADHLLTDARFGWSLAPVILLFELATALAVLTLAVAVVYDRLAPWLRQAIALPVGSTWLLASLVHHVALMVIRGPEPTDYTGVSAAVGGLAVVAAGLVARAQHGRGGSPHSVPLVRRPRPRGEADESDSLRLRRWWRPIRCLVAVRQAIRRWELPQDASS
jgi:hypothetical protein